MIEELRRIRGELRDDPTPAQQMSENHSDHCKPEPLMDYESGERSILQAQTGPAAPYPARRSFLSAIAQGTPRMVIYTAGRYTGGRWCNPF
jgi:hypothetical protein